jgi:hypothetical protein
MKPTIVAQSYSKTGVLKRAMAVLYLGGKLWANRELIAQAIILLEAERAVV